MNRFKSVYFWFQFEWMKTGHGAEWKMRKDRLQYRIDKTFCYNRVDFSCWIRCNPNLQNEFAQNVGSICVRLQRSLFMHDIWNWYGKKCYLIETPANWWSWEKAISLTFNNFFLLQKMAGRSFAPWDKVGIRLVSIVFKFGRLLRCIQTSDRLIPLDICRL